MNFLAHAYLSGDDPMVLIGNFIADAVKGNSFTSFPDGVQKGIRLHRLIDTYTDKHPAFKSSKKRLQQYYDKFSGVIVDIYYDHFLARNWDLYHHDPLRYFASNTYLLLSNNFFMLPARSKRILPFMVSQNWLVGYANLKALERVFQGMSNRVRTYNSGMEHAVDDLRKGYDSFHDDFKAFFPDIVSFTEDKQAEIGISTGNHGIKKG